MPLWEIEKLCNYVAITFFSQHGGNSRLITVWQYGASPDSKELTILLSNYHLKDKIPVLSLRVLIRLSNIGSLLCAKENFCNLTKSISIQFWQIFLFTIGLMESFSAKLFPKYDIYIYIRTCHVTLMKLEDKKMSGIAVTITGAGSKKLKCITYGTYQLN